MYSTLILRSCDFVQMTILSSESNNMSETNKKTEAHKPQPAQQEKTTSAKSMNQSPVARVVRTIDSIDESIPSYRKK